MSAMRWPRQQGFIVEYKSFADVRLEALLMKVQSKKLKILLLSLSYFCIFGYSNVSYLLPVYYSGSGFSAAEAGLLVSAFYFAALAFRLVLGNVLIRAGFRRIFVTGGVLAVVSAIWVILAKGSFICSFAARFLFGTGTAFSQIALAAYQSLAFREEERGFAYSMIMAGGLAPMMTAVPLADMLLAAGRPDAYIMLPLLLAVAALGVTLCINTDDVTLEAPAVRGGPLAGLGECLKMPGLVLALFSIFLFSIVDAAAAFMAPMTASLGLMASWFLSSNAVVGVAVRLTSGKLLDRCPRRKLAAPVTAVMAFTLVLASVHPSGSSLALLGIIYGAGMGLGFPLHLALVSDNAPDRLQPQAVSLMWFLYALDFATVPLVTAFITDFTSPVFAFRAVALFCAVGAVFAWLGWKRLSAREIAGGQGL